jgi:hypothetical protein
MPEDTSDGHDVPTRHTLLHSATIVALLAASRSVLRAQDLEPRAYSNSPTGLSFLIAGYTYAEGSVLTDPSLRPRECDE